MKHIVLNVGNIKSRRQLHAELRKALDLPMWYGRNLDALHDCVTDIHEDLTLELEGVSTLDDNLGGYGEVLLMVLRDCQEENPHFHLTVREEG